MSTTLAAPAERWITLDEYEQMPNNGQRTELVRGRIVPVNPPFPWHGYVCAQTMFLVGGFIKLHDSGYVMANDSGVVTERDPDTVRGADFAYYSYARVPKGTLKKKGYLAVVPDLIVEVRSPDDSWAKVMAKVAEYLNAGVRVVGVLDSQRSTLTVFQGDEPAITLTADQEWRLPEVLPGFVVRVGQFFE